mgnify:CR=1 FL=1
MPKITSYIILLFFPIFFCGQQHTVQQAEFFWGTSDPGLGNCTQLVAADGNFNEAVEQVFKNSIILPSTGGLHLFNIRVKNGSGSWGPVYKQTVYLGDNQRDMKITYGEYYWDNNFATALLIFDGNFDEALESVYNDSISIPATGGLHSFNIRVKDESNEWGPVYKRTVYLGDLQRDMHITAAEIFWGINDPGPGNGINILANDNNFDEALENLLSNNIFSPGPGINVFNIRVKDEAGYWGPLYKRTINNQLPLYQVEILNLHSSDTICYGDSLNLKLSGGTNPTWYPSGFVDDNYANQVKAYPNFTTQFMLIVDNIYSGVDTAYFTVYVEDLPIISVFNSLDTICNGDSIQISVSGTDTYLWNTGSTASSNIVKPNEDSTYIVQGSSIFGCKSTDSVRIVVNQPTSLQIIDSTCSYFLNGQTYSSPGLYQQDFINIVGCDSTIFLSLIEYPTSSTMIYDSACDVYNLNGQSYNVSGLYQQVLVNSRGCDSTVSLQLIIKDSSSNTIYNTSCDQYMHNGQIYTSSGTYFQNLVNSKGCDSLLELQLTINPTTYDTLSIASCEEFQINGYQYFNSGIFDQVFINQFGCDSIFTIDLRIDSLPYVYAGINQDICYGDTIILSASGADSYVWDNGVTNNVPFSINVTTTFTVTGTDLNGCSDTSQVTFTIQPSPNINLGSNQTICIGDQVTLNATGANNISWNNGVSNNVPFYPTQSSYYTVSGDNSYGCVSEDSVLVMVNPLPIINAGQDVNVCTGFSVTLSASGANNYVWNNNIINGQSFILSNTSSYIVLGTDNNGCVSSDTVIVTVNSLPNVIAGSDQTVCLGDDVTLSASGANSYSWTNGVINNVAFVPTSPNPNFVSSVSYTVTGTDNNGCTNTDIVLVTINPLPDIYAYSFINGVNTNNPEVDLCLGDSLRLYGDGAGTGIYEWDNGVMDNEWFAPTNSNIYNLTGTNDFTGCSDTDQITLTVNELPAIVETIINEEYGDDGSISIEVIAGTPPFDFDWDVDGLGDNDDFQDLTDLRGGTYVLIVTDDNGCQSRFTIVLENMTSLIIPSAITPNGDGVNDVWDIKGLHSYPEMQLQIFDRNGILLHEQQGLYTDWDGIYAGKQLPEGDYFYIIDLKNEERPYMGAVSIKF